MDIAIAREAAFAVHDDAFLDVLGSDPRLELVLETDAPEGPVYAPDEDALYFTTAPPRGPAGPRRPIRRLAPRGAPPPARASTSAAWRSTGRASRWSASG